MFLTDVVPTMSPTFHISGAVQLFVYGFGLGLGLAITFSAIPLVIKFMKSLL